ncbi:MAG TPA: ABC transporter ATP-binding protein [Syntrophorhabdaceae bacterium]|nr:ABC transporter ATP-binding protein [Syntrophorhabdaceae bacterium]
MSNPIIKVSGLKKTFHKDGQEVHVLKGIDFEADKGAFITIMGPSGAGKSTFLHIIGALDKATEGDVFFKDRNIRSFSEDEESVFRNEKIGFIFQFYHLLHDFNVIENIMMPLLIKGVRKEEAGKRAESFLEIVGLTHRGNHKPGELSGGEQQRVAIARALVNEPEVILADEPTGNLDRKTGHEVFEYILSVNKKLSSTLILVTHDPAVGAYGEKQYTMVDGELFDGTAVNTE